jgi:hypothetical protein
MTYKKYNSPLTFNKRLAVCRRFGSYLKSNSTIERKIMNKHKLMNLQTKGAQVWG